MESEKIKIVSFIKNDYVLFWKKIKEDYPGLFDKESVKLGFFCFLFYFVFLTIICSFVEIRIVFYIGLFIAVLLPAVFLCEIISTYLYAINNIQRKSNLIVGVAPFIIYYAFYKFIITIVNENNIQLAKYLPIFLSYLSMKYILKKIKDTPTGFTDDY